LSPAGKILKQLEAVCPGRVRSGEPLAPFTTWKIGGPAQWLVAPQDREELILVLRLLAESGRPWRILGRGSNVLVGDRGVSGAVVYLGPCWSWIKARERSAGTVHLDVGAGTALTEIVRYGLQNALTGMEFLVGIPGSAGGAWTMNAGSHGREMQDLTVSLTLVTAEGKTLQRNRAALGFGYRRLDLDPGSVIVSGVLHAARGVKEETARQLRALLELRKKTQPWTEPSGGSVFRNPPGDSAGRLIEASGCKGLIRGEAQVSEKHANFIVNRGRARARDVLSLMATVRKKVYEHSGVLLAPEVRLWGCALPARTAGPESGPRRKPCI
jgi:UDP-N-acetylmuramate dehydrogenase